VLENRIKMKDVADRTGKVKESPVKVVDRTAKVKDSQDSSG